MFEGIYTALVTPFKNGKVDYPSLKNLVQHQLENGVAGFVVNGTTAESPTLTPDEVEKIFKIVKKQARSTPIILGAGDNSTERTIKKVKEWASWKPDGFLLVTPYYNRPPQEGLYQHFKAIADVSKLPIVLYNVPTRTAVNMQLETVKRLAKHKQIVGIKEASGNMELASAMAKEIPLKFTLLSGDDKSCMDFCQRGGKGVISVISHVIPKQMSEICESVIKGNGGVQEWSHYSKLNDAMGLETNPIPVKAALKMMGVIASEEMRLPLVSISKDAKLKLRAELKSLGLVR